jgi:hypothetical protein
MSFQFITTGVSVNPQAPQAGQKAQTISPLPLSRSSAPPPDLGPYPGLGIPGVNRV